MTFMKRFLTAVLIIQIATAPAVDTKNCFVRKNSDSNDIPPTRYIFFNKKKNNTLKSEAITKRIEPRTYKKPGTYGANNIIANRTEKSLFVTELPPTPERPLYPENPDMKANY